MKLIVLSGRFAVCRLSPDAALPVPARGELWSATRTQTEVSVACAEDAIPSECLAAERGWCGLAVAGQLDFSLVGILAGLTGTLAAANISVFALSTFDTDYLLVKADTLERAIAALEGAGHSITYELWKAS